MYQDYKDLLCAFHARGVRYLIVGGYAVIFHAQPRFTKDMTTNLGAELYPNHESRVPQNPNFLLGFCDQRNFMRLSLMKAAHGALGGAAYRKFGSFALFAKGGIPRISRPTVAYPTLCQERKGWGTRPPVVCDSNRVVLFLVRVSDLGP